MSSESFPIRRALISVSDKTGVLAFVRALVAQNVEILSTGGTAALFRENAIPVTDVSSVTGFPEIMDGRVKTLHPTVHGGILARRDKPEHLAALAAHGIGAIDLVAVNLYPFEKAVAAEHLTLETAIENIDIGGPAMVRAAAKNYPSVTVVVDPADYETVLADMQAHGGTTQAATRFRLAKTAFGHTSRYDGMVAGFLSALENTDGALTDTVQRNAFPQTLSLQFEKAQDMRYGENPHQAAAFYRDLHSPGGLLAHYRQLQGKALSFNNIADADTAWECARSFAEPACVIVKHANPCGVATADKLPDTYRKALQTDPSSAFGGIIAFNRDIDEFTAQAVVQKFVEVVIAPAISPAALAVFAAKPSIRLLEVVPGNGHNAFDIKRVGGGLLVQTPDVHDVQHSDLRVVTERQPTAAEWLDLHFAWRVAKFVKSNAIVFCKDGMTLGVGAGQMSRLDSARIASIKSAGAGLSLKGSAVASDAFFPFRDGLDVVIDAGASCVIHPGGSLRDDDVIAAANERGIAMVLTGVRHFRH
ncbi:MAG: bifunctional phosphoribosylaminoimidazolecarboxamide formyltransferase/IMP cyclohydrolase [Burkholderiaceae bacterium]